MIRKISNSNKDKKTQSSIGNSCICTRGGFSLVETMVAVFVFMIAVSVISGVFANLLKNYASAKKTEKAFEDANYAMNQLAKTLRTSSVAIAPVASSSLNTTNVLRVLDNSRPTVDNCIEYSYNSSTKKFMMKSGNVTDANVTTCQNMSLPGSPVAVTIADVNSVRMAIYSPAVPYLKRIVISLNIDEPGKPNGTTIETTISLRNN